MAKYPVKLLKDKDGTAFIPVVNSDSIITPEGDTLNDLLEEKQDLLTSGTNIKTINNESLLGSGNISIQGGGGTTNYTDLTNKPQINGVTLSGNKTTSDLGITIPTKVSDLTNDTGFITNTTNNLTNYYTKTNTYTKTEVDQLIGAISTLNIEIVQTLPATGSTSTIYLVPKTASTNDNYDEYIYVSNSWEHIGSTEVDLTNYYTKTETDNKYALKSLYGDTTINVGRKENTTVGAYSTAEGESTTASAEGSHAEGSNTVASNYFAHAEGWYSTASGHTSHAEGDHTTASGSKSHAEGYYTKSSGKYSHAEGENTEAKGQSQHVSGKYNIVDNNNTYAEIIGNGTSSTRSNARTLDWNGNEVLAGSLTINGNQTVATTTDLATTESTFTALLDGKQDTLNSGTNIKTINGLSLVGAGNITIEPGGTISTGDMLRATYDVNSNGIVDNAELVNGHSVNSDVPSNAVFTDTAAGYIHIWTDTTYSGRVNMGTDDLGLYLFPNGGYFDSLSIDKGGAVLLTEIPDHGRKFYCFDAIYQNSSSIYRLMYGSGTSYGNYKDLRLDNIVMQSRKINGHELYTDVTLDADDVGALPDNTTYVSSINNLTGDVNISVPTKVSDLTNDSGFITGITSTDVTTALGYTPYDSSNPSGYTTNTGTITGVSVNGTSVATSGVANITSVPASMLSGAIPSAVTATTQTSSDNSTKIATTAFVKTAIDNLPEPMVFKGSLGTGGTITSLPTNGTAAVGDTYKVITDGTYASKAAKAGDTFICLTKTSSANTWELIPSGDDTGGTVTSVKINATSPIAIDNNAAITTSGERTISHANSGVTAGTYKSVTVDSKGHVTAGTNPTTLSGYGITDAKISNGTITLGSNTITPSTVQNIKDGSATGSVRTSSSSSENTNYTIGTYAFAEGSSTRASGNASHAEGGYTKAFGDNSHAEGWGSEASGNQSHAEGNATVAAGDYSHSEGYHTTANEDYSHSEGYYTTASGNYGAHSEGYNTVAKGSYSHSEGKYTVASKDGSHAEGYWARAVGKNSHSEGGWDSSSPYNIVGTVVSIDTENKTYEVSGLTRYINSDNNYVGAMYYHTSSGSDESYYISSETYDTTTNNFTFGVSYMDSSIVVEGSFYIKISSVALGDFSHSEGRNTFAIGSSSHAEGWSTTARYNGSHAEGCNTYAGPFAHAEGYYTEANGDHSHSEGDHTQANGNYSHSEGYYTEANGKYSHSEGIYTKGTGDYSHVEGWGSEASGSYSHAEGDHTTASGREGSHAEGYATVAAGASSHAEGGYSGYFQQGTVVSVDAENKTYEVSGLPVLYNASGYPIYNGASYSKATSGYFNDSYIIISSTRSNDNYIFTVSSFYTTIAVGDPFYITMGSKAQGNYSHAEGQTCLAIGSGSHAEGNRTIASGSYSHTEGDHTEASGSSSHAGGYFTKANKSYQTAIGKYNQNVYNALLEVGNGTADDARSNAFVVYSDGRAVVGADPTTAMGVATKQYVDTKDGDLTNLTTTTKTDLVSAINEVNSNVGNTNNVISVGLTANTNVSSNATWTHYTVPIDDVKATIGNKLTFNSSTHRVSVGDGVSYVKVSVYTLLRGITSGIEFNVRKNGSGVVSLNVQPRTTSIFENAAAYLIVPVSSGDYFDFTIRTGATGTITIAGGSSTAITFEAMN